MKLGARLKALVEACENMCVAECCGIGAFDFSPLHITSHLSAFTGTISEADLSKVEAEIDAMVSHAVTFSPDQSGNICSIEGMNQYFTEMMLTVWPINSRPMSGLPLRFLSTPMSFRNTAER